MGIRKRTSFTKLVQARLRPEDEKWLLSEAAKRGRSAASYVRHLVQEAQKEEGTTREAMLDAVRDVAEALKDIARAIRESSVRDQKGPS